MSNNVREQFPIFSKHPNLVYLDNAATTQKPQSVIAALTQFYSQYNANVHRGMYPLSEKSTDMYEAARHSIARFINAEDTEVIFTAGTTDGLNAAHTMLRNRFKTKDAKTKIKVLTSELEHHSSVLPWLNDSDVEVRFWEVDNDYEIKSDSEYLETLKSFTPDVVAITMASNVTGTIVDVEMIRKTFPDAYLVVDAAQTVGHIQIDVQKLRCDLLAFSGHKMYGPTGIGVLYINKKLQTELEPFKVGGGMISEVTKDKITWAESPEKYEAGTPPIADAIGLSEAVKFIQSIGWERITAHEQALRLDLLSKLKTVISADHIYHPLSNNALGIVAFNIPDVHPHDAAYLLGDFGVAVRAGHHCNQILHRSVLKASSSIRISLGVYNTESDIDKFVTELKHVLDSKLQKHG